MNDRHLIIALLLLFASILFCLVMAFTTQQHWEARLDCLIQKTYEAPKSARGAPIAAPEGNHAAR